MTTMQKTGGEPLTLDSLVSIIWRSVERWGQGAAFVALTVRHTMEYAWEQQRRPNAVTNYPAAENDPGSSTSKERRNGGRKVAAPKRSPLNFIKIMKGF